MSRRAATQGQRAQCKRYERRAENDDDVHRHLAARGRGLVARARAS